MKIYTMNRLSKIRRVTLTINQKLALFSIVLFMYDIWFNLIAYLFSIVFEFVEYYLEISIQYVLGVRHHASEIIALNFLLLLAFTAMIYLWFSLPRILHYLNILINKFKTQFVIFWQSQPLLGKIKLSATYLLISSGFITFLCL